jgi:hypothetical protein
MLSGKRGNHMTLEVELIQYEGHLEVIAWGEYYLEDTIKKFSDLLGTCRLMGVPKVLIDCCTLWGGMGATEKTLYALRVENFYNEHLASGGDAIQMAFVTTPRFVSSFEPGHEIGRRDELPFSLFQDVKEAREWLGASPRSE